MAARLQRVSFKSFARRGRCTAHSRHAQTKTGTEQQHRSRGRKPVMDAPADEDDGPEHGVVDVQVHEGDDWGAIWETNGRTFTFLVIHGVLNSIYSCISIYIYIYSERRRKDWSVKEEPEKAAGPISSAETK